MGEWACEPSHNIRTYIHIHTYIHTKGTYIHTYQGSGLVLSPALGRGGQSHKRDAPSGASGLLALVSEVLGRKCI